MGEKKIGYRDVFRQKEYMKMILAALINRFGDSIDAIAFTWIVYEITGNAAWSAMVYGVNKLPTVIISPLAGAWVEGRDKKKIMVITDLIRAVCVAFVATGYLTGILQAWMLLVTTFVISTVEAFRGPANMALTPRVLKKEYYEYGMSLMSTLGSIVELIGTAVAATVIALIGTSGAIYIDMTTFVLSALIIQTVTIKERETEKQKFDGKKYMASLRDGFHYVMSDKLVIFLCGVTIFLNGILVPLNSLEAPMANEILHGGAEVLSILGIAATIGMLFGSFVFPYIQEKLGEKPVLVGCTFGIAMFYIGIPICQPFYQNKLFMYGFVACITIFLGIMVALCNSLLNVITMKRVDEGYLARIGGISSALDSMAIPIISFLVSMLVGKLNTTVIFVISGLFAIGEGIYIGLSKELAEEKAEERTLATDTM